MKYALVILMLFSLSCEKPKLRKDTPVKGQAPETVSEVVMTPVPPPAEPPKPINPRVREPQFSVEEKTVEAVKLPAGEGPVQYMLAGRFDASTRQLLAYVMTDRIQFRAPDGALVAVALHQGFPRLVRLVPGTGKRPDRVLTGWGRNPISRSPEERITFTLTDASGMTPEKKPATVHEVIHQTTSKRADPQDAVAAADGSIYMAWFSDKYTVQVGQRAPSGGEVKILLSASMIGRISVVEKAGGGHQLIVARVYGDEPGSDGGLFLFEDGRLKPLPTVRGVRGLWALTTKEGFDAWIGDGWDKDYGKVARAFLSVVSIRGQTIERRQITELTGSYSVMSIVPCNWHGPGRPGLVIKTNNSLFWIDEAATTAPELIARWGSPADPVIVDLDGDRNQEILIVSPEPTLLKARK
ncbi:hypothetical protein KJ975_08070 [Myxococcota bacterium]|nr:hypothetical protein [Myxococcota bacterium]